jgi:hypothetical protein
MDLTYTRGPAASGTTPKISTTSSLADRDKSLLLELQRDSLRRYIARRLFFLTDVTLCLFLRLSESTSIRYQYNPLLRIPTTPHPLSILFYYSWSRLTPSLIFEQC